MNVILQYRDNARNSDIGSERQVRGVKHFGFCCRVGRNAGNVPDMFGNLEFDILETGKLKPLGRVGFRLGDDRGRQLIFVDKGPAEKGQCYEAEGQYESGAGPAPAPLLAFGESTMC